MPLMCLLFVSVSYYYGVCYNPVDGWRPLSQMLGFIVYTSASVVVVLTNATAVAMHGREVFTFVNIVTKVATRIKSYNTVP